MSNRLVCGPSNDEKVEVGCLPTIAKLEPLTNVSTTEKQTITPKTIVLLPKKRLRTGM